MQLTGDAKQIETLSTLARDKRLSKELDKTLAEGTRELKNANDGLKGEASKRIFAKVRLIAKKAQPRLPQITAEELEEAAMLYAALDKAFFCETPSQLLEAKDIGIRVKGKLSKRPSEASYKITGRTLEDIYKAEYFEPMEFLSENLEILPKTTQKYVTTKLKEAELRPQMEKISNQFELKVYIRHLKNEFDQKKIKTHLKFFRKLLSHEDKTTTLFYLIQAIKETQKEGNEHQAEALIEEARGTLKRTLRLQKTRNLPLDLVLRLLREDPDLEEELNGAAAAIVDNINRPEKKQMWMPAWAKAKRKRRQTPAP